MTPDEARKQARALYQDTDPSTPDYGRRTLILRKLVAAGCDPVYAATAAGFEIAATPPPWLTGLAESA